MSWSADELRTLGIDPEFLAAGVRMLGLQMAGETQAVTEAVLTFAASHGLEQAAEWLPLYMVEVIEHNAPAGGRAVVDLLGLDGKAVAAHPLRAVIEGSQELVDAFAAGEQEAFAQSWLGLCNGGRIPEAICVLTSAAAEAVIRHITYGPAESSRRIARIRARSAKTRPRGRCG